MWYSQDCTAVTTAHPSASTHTYTVNHKKRGSLFLTITLANLNRNQSPSCIHTKPVIANRVPKLVAMATSLST